LKEANSKAETIIRQADLDGKQAAYEYEVQAEKKNKEKQNQLQQNENKLLRREDCFEFP
jgi:ribonuclease Y